MSSTFRNTIYAPPLEPYLAIDYQILSDAFYATPEGRLSAEPHLMLHGQELDSVILMDATVPCSF